MTVLYFLLSLLAAIAALLFTHYGSKWIHKITGGDEGFRMTWFNRFRRKKKRFKEVLEEVKAKDTPISFPTTGRMSATAPNISAPPRGGSSVHRPTPSRVVVHENRYEEEERRRQAANHHIQSMQVPPTMYVPTVVEEDRSCHDTDTHRHRSNSAACHSPVESHSSPSSSDSWSSSSSSSYESSSSSSYDSSSSDSGSSWSD